MRSAPPPAQLSRREVLSLFGGGLAVGTAGCAGVLAEMGPVGSTLPFEFVEVTADRGISYRTTGAGISNTSAGVYVNDFNRDGLEDVLLLGGERPILYENRGGTFDESTALPPVDDWLAEGDRVHSAHFLDFDNDGWEDLLLLPGGGHNLADYTDPVEDEPEESNSRPILLANDGGTFRVAEVLDVELARWPIGAAAADYDGDGYLDVFIYQNGDWAVAPPTGYRNPESRGRIEHRDDLEDNGNSNILLKGDGESFDDVSAEAGIEGARWSLAASFVDLTNDGYPDIHVANDFNEDVIYLNNGDGTFEQRFMGPESDRNQMSSEVQDLTGNGLLDIYVTNIDVSEDQLDLSAKEGRVFVKQQAAGEPRSFGGNNLWINRGNGEFVDQAAEYDVKDSPFTWGWDALMIDLNNNGWLDIVHSNNQVDRVTSEGDERVVIQSEPTEPGVWANGGENDFAPISAKEVGFKLMNERGLASLDLDVDGFRDLIFVEDGGPARLYENTTDDGGHWFQLIVEGDGTQTPIGARATLTAGSRTQLMVNDCKSDFQSQNTRVLHWGLGDRTTVDELHVVWPDGTERVLTELAVDRRVRLAPHEDPEEVVG